MRFRSPHFSLAPEKKISERANSLLVSAVESGVYVWLYGLGKPGTIISCYNQHGRSFISFLDDTQSSFILFDSANDTLVAVSSFLGSFPIYYHCADQERFIFSFSIRGLLDTGEFEPEINLNKVRDYLNFDPARQIDNHTFYHRVYQILPAHYLLIQSGRIIENRLYGSLDYQRFKTFDTKALYDKHREFLFESVSQHLAKFSSVGASLSGGLDSSSICCIAQKIRSEPVHTYHFDTNTAEGNEYSYIELFTGQTGNIHRLVTQTHTPFTALSTVVKQNAQPDLYFNYSNQIDIINQAKQDGCDVFLSGHFGDQVIGHGLLYFAELIANKQWKALRKAIQQHLAYFFLQENKKIGQLQLNGKKMAFHLLLQHLPHKKISKRIRACYLLFRFFNVGINDLMQILKNKRSVKNKRRNLPVVTDRFSSLAAIQKETSCNNDKKLFNPERLLPATATDAERKQLLLILREDGFIRQEEFLQIYRKNGLYAAQPFMNKKLIEVSLATPLAVKFCEGMKRGALRGAMKGYLPEEILNRHTKAEFSSYHNAQLLALYKEFGSAISSGHDIWNIVDRNNFHAIAAICFNTQIHVNNKSSELLQLKRVMSLAIWLDIVAAERNQYFERKKLA